MRFIRWVEGRISGRKKLKDGSTTSADDQFVYHPSPFRNQLSHIATPAHNPPPKLHHQLERRLNEQLKERLSIHLTNDNNNNSKIKLKNKKQLTSVQLRRTASALESRTKPKKLLFNRTSEYSAIEHNSTITSDPYSLPSAFENDSLAHSYANDELISSVYENDHLLTSSRYENMYQNEYLSEFENEMLQNRYSSITHASNESAFFDCSSSLAQEASLSKFISFFHFFIFFL